jgi:hypothetical protein
MLPLRAAQARSEIFATRLLEILVGAEILNPLCPWSRAKVVLPLAARSSAPPARTERTPDQAMADPRARPRKAADRFGGVGGGPTGWDAARGGAAGSLAGRAAPAVAHQPASPRAARRRRGRQILLTRLAANAVRPHAPGRDFSLAAEGMRRQMGFLGRMGR